MALPNIAIPRQQGQLKRTAPSEDALVCYVISGTAVAGKIGLSDPKQLFGTAALATLGITAANNALAFKEITAFYAKAGEGAELNIMLVANTTLFVDMCDKANDIVKKLVESTQGRAVIVAVNKTFPSGYTATLTNGLDTDVVNAKAKLNELALAYDAENTPFVAVLPGYGFVKAAYAALPLRSLGTHDYVAISLVCDNNDGIVSLGTLTGWLAKHQVHQNIARVASGKVSDTAFFPDLTPVMDSKENLGAIHDKGFIIYRKIGGKSGFFFNDDPTQTAITSDYSSISWNRIINKAKRLAYLQLVEKLNDDVDKDPATGKILTTVAADWESDVETAIRNSMMKASGTKVAEINGIKCTVDTNSDIINDQVDASLTIVRKGQAKTITLAIGYKAAQ